MYSSADVVGDSEFIEGTQSELVDFAHGNAIDISEVCPLLPL